MQDFVLQVRQLLDNMPDIVSAIIVIVLVLNAIAWFFLPFAVFGIKTK